MNHTRSISLEELIEQFWPEADSRDPGNALKNMIFRARSYLKKMFPEQKELLQKRPGCYMWNPDVKIEVDTEQFEQGYLESRKAEGEERVRLLFRTVSLYKGDFLAGNESDWTAPLRHYYQTLYLDACKEVLSALQEEERWTEMIGICEQAYEVDFSMDSFVVYHMQALIALGQPEKAVERYQMFRKALWQEYEIEPMEQVEEMHVLAAGMCQDTMDSQNVLELVSEAGEENGAFFCTFGVFRSIVALERRHLARSRQPSTLVIVSLGDQIAPTTDARRLQRVLMEGLRTGDLVARLDAGSYIVMLSGASVENAWQVAGRVEQKFRRAYANSNANITFRMSSLEPLTAQ
ncbi:MAG: hypothetical protein HFI92_10160 [Lachnospiraceae bacterium]|nr:hypothetical protein [Lachnospiraceae bacterium]